MFSTIVKPCERKSEQIRLTFWNGFTGPFSFPFLGYRGQGRLITTLIHEEFKTLGDKYGNLIFFKLFMDQPILIVRGYELVKVSCVRCITLEKNIRY